MMIFKNSEFCLIYRGQPALTEHSSETRDSNLQLNSSGLVEEIGDHFGLLSVHGFENKQTYTLCKHVLIFSHELSRIKK